MSATDSFSTYHPLVNFLYFALVLIFTMFLLHPVLLAMSLLGALVWSLCLKGRRALRFALCALLPLFALAALLNPAFSHEGVTILAYLPGGNPLTLESILYGLAAAGMLVAVLLWFSCYNEVMTADKFVYLFGRVIPALSLVLSMTLRFVPKFRAQLKQVAAAQRCVGRGGRGGSLRSRARRGVTMLSILVTWSLENAVETADSMRARGYGLPGRSAFSLYRFDDRDRAALLFELFCGVYVAVGRAVGALDWRWFPSVRAAAPGAYGWSLYAVYLALCLLPAILHGWEGRTWRRLRSGI